MIGVEVYPTLAVHAMTSSIEVERGEQQQQQQHHSASTAASSRPASRAAMTPRPVSIDATSNSNSTTTTPLISSSSGLTQSLAAAATSALSPRSGISTPSTHVRTPAVGLSDSSDLMYEECVRILACSATEIHTLMQLRKKGGGPAASSASSVPSAPPSSSHPPNAHTGTLPYASLSGSAADSLAAHFLFSTNVLTAHVTRYFTQRYHHYPRGNSMQQHDNHHLMFKRCCEPSPLPIPHDYTICQQAAQAAAQATPEMNSNVTLGLLAAAAAQPSSSSVHSTPTSPSNASVSSASIRRTVLPFSNIGLLEKNILGLKTSKGAQMRNASDSSSAAEPTSHQQQQAHPRDIQLLQTHFTQLLAEPLGSHSLQHPYGLIVSEFLTQFHHQALHIASASHPSVPITRGFLTAQLNSIFTFLSSHETFVIVSYPYFYVTTLCKRLLRSCLRAYVLNHPLLLQPLWKWYERVYEEEERQFTMRCDELKEVTLADLGVPFPFSMNTKTLVEQAEEEEDGDGEEVDEHGKAVRRRRVMQNSDGTIGTNKEAMSPRALHSSDGSDYEEDSLGVQQMVIPPSSSFQPRHGVEEDPVDTLIHSDDESSAVTSGEVKRKTSSAARRQKKRTASTSQSKKSQRRGSSLLNGLNNNQMMGSTTTSPAPVVLPEPAVNTTTQQQQQQLQQQSMIKRNASTNSLPADVLSDTPRAPSLLSSSSPRMSMLPAPDSTVTSQATGANNTSGNFTLPDSSYQYPRPLPLSHSPSMLHPDTLPYSRSITILSTLDSTRTVEEKLDCLVRCCRMITQELQEFCKEWHLGGEEGDEEEAANTSFDSEDGGILSSGKQYQFTCDELFQVFAYCLLQSQVSSPLSHMHLINDTITGEALNDERGYCLTTMQCAVAFISGFKEAAACGEEDASREFSQVIASSYSIKNHSAYLGGTTSSAATKSTTSSALSSPIVTNKSSSITPSIVPTTPSSSSSSHTLTPSESHHFASLLSANLDAFLLAADYATLDTDWSWLYEKDGITVYRKYYPANPIASIKGTGIIQRTPQQVQGFLRNINSRVEIDDLYLGGRVLLHVSPETKLVHYRFRARNWCSRTQTDMCLLLYNGLAPDGVTLITLAFSVKHSSCPSTSEYSRSTVRASGWLFKPVQNGRATHVTYLVSPDANSFPAWVVNVISQKQPMIIRNVREHLYATTAAESSVATTAPSSPATSQAGGTPISTAFSNSSHSRRLSEATPPMSSRAMPMQQQQK